ncbi:MAG: T9SS type A sorting domain-containing protein [Saprospiraceae bacterium]|nr:T9SS type A sorting domain-containing protein [Saprospiraceae bacterium]
MNNLLTIPTVIAHQFVKLLNPITSQNNGVLRFKYTQGDLTDTLVSLAYDVKFSSENDFTWTGEIPEFDGNLTLSKGENGVHGFIMVDTIKEDYFTFNDTISLMIRHKAPDNLFVDDIVDTTEEVGQEVGNCDAGNECAAQIKVLVLVDPTTNNFFNNNAGRRNTAIFDLINQLNISFQRSNIAHRASYEIKEINWAPQTNPASIRIDVEQLPTNVEAINLRNNTKADIVVLLTSWPYAIGDGYGWAASYSPIPDNIESYCIVQLKHAFSPNLVFSHEIGHLLGAGHEHGMDPRYWVDCNAGWEIIPNKFYTVMHLSANVPPPRAKYRILQFSDPEINFQGNPTGSNGYPDPIDPQLILKQAKNAGIIRANGCFVSEFQGSTNLSVTIAGDNSICENPEIYKAMVTPPPSGQAGQPPYTYEWRWNLDGIFTTLSPGTLLAANTQEISIPPPNVGICQFFFLKVIVSSGGITGESIKRISNSCNTICSLQEILIGRQKLSNVESMKKQIFPNPISSDDDLSIELNTNHNGSYELKLLDLFGKIILEKSMNLLSDQKINLRIPKNTLPGYYILKLESHNFNESYSIMIK